MEKERGNCLVDNPLQEAIQKELFADIPEEVLNWSSVSLSEVLKEGLRLEASCYKIQGKHAREVTEQCKWGKKPLSGTNGFGFAYHRPRFRRIFVGKSGIPIYQPAQINEIYPKPELYISELTKTDIEKLRVKRNQILLTCSGTIGNVTLVSDTLDNCVFSHDLIRINIHEETNIGYIYAFLKTKIGYVLITTNNYGAVVQHIEPIHLENLLLPNPDETIKRQIAERVLSSFKLRDESNKLIDEAENSLLHHLDLPPLEELNPAGDSNLNCYQVRLSLLNERLDGSYHVPTVEAIVRHIETTSARVTTLGDSSISKQIILPGRFKRVYVAEGQGRVFFGGKQIYDLDPSGEKYLSLVRHRERLKGDLAIQENTVLVTRSGTIGKVNIAPRHWEGWIPNEHIIRIVPSGNEIAGYIYSWLNTEYGYELIKRFTYGAVVDEIDANQVSQVQIPILRNGEVQQKINSIVLEANQKRYEAYILEQEALKLVNDLVVYA